MLAGIRRQREVLDHLEKKALEAERRRDEAERIASKMEDDMHNLESEVSELKVVKDALILEMEDDEFEMTKYYLLMFHKIFF